MSESDWLACEDPGRMLSYLTNVGVGGASVADLGQRLISDRKLRLFGVACMRHVKRRRTDDEGLTVLDLAEQVADGQLTLNVARSRSADVLGLIGDHWCLWEDAAHLAREMVDSGEASECWPTEAALLRDIVGNPFRPARVTRACDDCGGAGWWPKYARECGSCAGTGRIADRRRCPWLTPTVLGLATAAYDERLSGGALDPVRLAVLSDALEEAGAEGELLSHLRSAGPHVRGCWALDLILGKE